ncbi:hypothetical protein SAMN02910298_02580 [Pseudobutyrivibrio sp. YE44]|uniref:hypothetical protein n=1 Tax=Pseudobutyrivibrio sp. YE44 TaxID=1520802 RepID=UPI00088F6159|nr:hypothetical protein [Pseudobutyrivibrio sp. YE44]SDB50720.1 hypothetical protein SAMN02910298_02580 [Pseudobutyrivibrio sp. YE44]
MPSKGQENNVKENKVEEKNVEENNVEVNINDINAISNDEEEKKDEEKKEEANNQVKGEALKQKTKEELDKELKELRKKEKDEAALRKAEEKLEKEKAKIAKEKAAREKKEEKKRKKQEREDAYRRAGKKPPRLFDRGLLPAVGFGVGALVGSLIGYTVVVAPLVIFSLFSAVVKGASYAVKSYQYFKKSREEAKKVGEKKAEQKEKEDSKKSEKELEKSKAKEKEKVKAPEVKDSELKQKSADKNKKQPEYTPEQKAFFDWNKEQRDNELSFINKEHSDFVKGKELFLNRLSKLCMLKEMEVAEKNNPGALSSKEYKSEFNKNVKVYRESSKAFKSLADSIKSPEDMEKVRTLVNEDNGNGLYNELAKRDENISKIDANVEKSKQKSLEIDSNQLKAPNLPNM